MKQAACTKNKILIVAEDFQGLLCKPIPVEKELPINISHLLSEAIWAGIKQEALFIGASLSEPHTSMTALQKCVYAGVH